MKSLNARLSAKLTRATGLRSPRDLAAVDPVIGTMLRWGVLAAATVILLGIVLYVVEGGVRPILFAPRGVPAGVELDPHSLRVVLDHLGPREPAAVTDLGLLLLIVTPVASVAIAIVAFARERDWMYVGLATFVFAMLMLSFVLGKA